MHTNVIQATVRQQWHSNDCEADVQKNILFITLAAQSQDGV